jgi:predicted O-methyltransferase YrrM
MTSLEAAGLYKDNSLDFVLLDASHTYEDVKADIQAWLPKIKSGGILAGDDYHVSWPGVINAVNEMFTDVQIVNDVSWAYKKP